MLRKAVFVLVLLLTAFAAYGEEAGLSILRQPAFPGYYIYPRGFGISSQSPFDVVDAANAALRVSCVTGDGCDGVGVGGNADGFLGLGVKRYASMKPHAYTGEGFAPIAPLLLQPAFPGIYGYLRGYTDAAGVFEITDATNNAVRINCVAGCSGGGLTIGEAATGGAPNRVLFEDGSEILATDADLTFATSTLTATNIVVPTLAAFGAASATAANAVSIGETANCITFEGATADTIQSRLCATDPTVGDHSYFLPNLTGGAHDGNLLAVNTTTNAVWSGASSSFVTNWSGETRFLGGVTFTGNITGQRLWGKSGLALTEAGGAETVLTITNATTQTFGVELSYRVTATDATNRATREGAMRFVCDNAATVMTCTKNVTAETDDGSVLIATGGATLTYAIAMDVTVANTAKVTFNIDSSLVVSAASITWTATVNGTTATIS